MLISVRQYGLLGLVNLKNPEKAEDIDELEEDDMLEDQELEVVEADQILWPDVP